jgi:endonuclease/exonuclease/phosphatase family metal-dependent hydrolase
VTRPTIASCLPSESESDNSREFTLAAFNAHWGYGRFGANRGVRFDVAALVREWDVDVIVVPESRRAHDGEGMLDALHADGYHVETIEMMDLERRRRNRETDRDAVPPAGIWELAVCSRLPVLQRKTYPIGTVPTDPPGERHALALTVAVGGTPVEVIGLHTSSKVWFLAGLQHLYGLKRRLRSSSGPQVIAGDFNFWGPPIAALMPGWHRPVRGRTYPAPRPHSQIDHVLVRGGIEAVTAEVLAPTLSDHRPIRTRLRLTDGVA